MGAELTTYMNIEDSQFNKKLADQKKELAQYKRITEGVSSSLKSFGLQFAAIVGVSEIFNTAINSTLQNQREFQSTLDGCKASVDNFFASLSTGDWSAFDDGIMHSILNAKKAAKALSESLDIAEFGKIEAELYEGKRNKSEHLVLNKSLNTEQRTNARDDAIMYAKKEIEVHQKNIKATEEKLLTILQSIGYGDMKIDAEKFSHILASLRNPASDIYNEVIQYAEKMDRLSAKKMGELFGAIGSAGFADKYYDKAISDYEKTKNKDLDFQRALLNYVSDKKRGNELSEIIDRLKDSYEKMGEAQRFTTDIQEDFTKIEKEVADKNKEQKKKEQEALEGSIKALDKLIASKKAEFDLAIDNQSRVRLGRELDELTKKRTVIIETVEELKNPMSIHSLTEKSYSNSDYEFGMEEMELPTFDNDNLQTSSDIIGGMIGMMSQLSTITSLTTSSWLNYATNVISTTQQMLPVLLKMIGTQKTLAAAEAIAGAAASGPFGWITAGLALASILASIAAIPKFAEGGIVQGLPNDRSIAKVSDGEMIMNSKQQRDLWSFIKNGSSNNNTIDVGNQVKFHIEGKELVGVLNNYNNKHQKIS